MVGVGTDTCVGEGNAATMGTGVVVGVGSAPAVMTPGVAVGTAGRTPEGTVVAAAATAGAIGVGLLVSEVAAEVGVETGVVPIATAGTAPDSSPSPPPMLPVAKSTPPATAPINTTPTRASNRIGGRLLPTVTGSSSIWRTSILPVLSMVNCSIPGSPRKRPARR